MNELYGIRGAGDVTYAPDTGVYSAVDTVTISGITDTGTGTASSVSSAPDRTASDWSRVGSAAISSGSQAALSIFRGLNAADQQRAVSANTAALRQLSSSGGACSTSTLPPC